MTVVAGLLALALVAGAQEPLPAGPVTIHYWPEQESLARHLAGHIERAPTLPALPHDVLEYGPVNVYLAPDQARWDSLTGGAVPEWGAGVADPDRGLIVLPTYDWGRKPLHSVQRTLRHELAHVGLQRYLGPARTPRWFTEGYAQWAAGQWDWEAPWRLRLALAGRRAPPLDSLTLDWPSAAGDARVAYLLSASAVAYLVDRSGDRGLRIFLERWREEQDFERAFRAVYGRTVGQFEGDWRRHVKRSYGWGVLLSHSALFWLLAALVLAILFATRRRRDRERMERLRATEPPDDPAYWDPMPPDEPAQGA
jgi:MYXO-CTERM domain-containing protein